MSYLEQLKSENMLQGALTKPTKGASVSFVSTTKRVFSPKKDNSDLGRAEAVFNFLADQGRACSESEILAAVAGDETKGRNILFRLAAERVIEYLGRGLYQVDAPMPELPAVCPLRTGGGVPRGCAYHPKFFSRLLETGTLTTGGHCPLVRVCGVNNNAST